MVPCKDCPKRELGCHSKCEVYKNFSAGREMIREKKFKESIYLSVKYDYRRRKKWLR